MTHRRSNEDASLKALMLTPDEGHLDRRIVQEAGTLARAGWQVDIHPSVDAELRYVGDLPEGVRILRNVQPPARSSRVRRLLRPIKRLTTAATPVLGRVIETVQYRSRSIAGEITEAGLPQLLRFPRYDLVFAHDVPVMPLAIALKTRWNAGLISDLHEIFPEQDEHFTSFVAKRYWREIEGQGVAASDVILCVNAAVADYVRRSHAPKAPIVTISNAVPYVTPERLRAGPTIRDLYPIAPATRAFLFAGSLLPNKGLETLVEGFAQARLDGWALAILGEGPLLTQLERRIAESGLRSTVHVGRRVAQRDLIQVAASADVGLLPYSPFGLNYLIATPNKLYEYIQARLPIASSRLPMIERVTAPLGIATFVDFGTPETTAQGLVAVAAQARDDDMGKRLERAARDLCWEREEAALLSAVDRCLHGSASPGSP